MSRGPGVGIEQAGVGEEQGRIGVAEDLLATSPRPGGIDWQIGPAGLEDCLLYTSDAADE